MRNFVSSSRRTWERFLINAALILVVIFAMLPIATTVLISFKSQQDITRNPPVIFPCDTPTQSFDLSACRWAVEGYERVFAPKPSSSSPLGFTLTGNMLRIYIPNTLLYAYRCSRTCWRSTRWASLCVKHHFPSTMTGSSLL
jgi:ABC-type glycerol-3-phosphate transport system permease component